MQFIDAKQLEAKVTYSRRQILNLEKAGRFPKRIALSSRRVVWDEAEVEAWMDRQRANALPAKPMAVQEVVQPSTMSAQS